MTSHWLPIEQADKTKMQVIGWENSEQFCFARLQEDRWFGFDPSIGWYEVCDPTHVLVITPPGTDICVMHGDPEPCYGCQVGADPTLPPPSAEGNGASVTDAIEIAEETRNQYDDEAKKACSMGYSVQHFKTAIKTCDRVIAALRAAEKEAGK